MATPPNVVLIAPTEPPVDGANGVVEGRVKQPVEPSFPPPPVIDPPPPPVEPPPTPLPPPEPPPPPPVEPPDPPVLPPIPPIPPPLTCAAPLVACRGVCIPVDNDPANCGACGKICPSNICLAGVCQGATPGDVVLIGHEYGAVSYGSSQAKILANAISIPTTDPIRVLTYEDGASPAAVAQVIAIAKSAIRGRSVQFTRAASASTLESSTLALSYDLVLIHDTNMGDPAATGLSWASSLGTFAAKGGVVVALDQGSYQMPALLSNTGLLTVPTHTKLALDTHLLVTAAADVVGAQVLSPYASFGAPVSFQWLQAPGADLNWVVRERLNDGSPGDPVVVHRVVR